jgi:hypothetical protein
MEQIAFTRQPFAMPVEDTAPGHPLDAYSQNSARAAASVITGLRDHLRAQSAVPTTHIGKKRTPGNAPGLSTRRSEAGKILGGHPKCHDRQAIVPGSEYPCK